MTDVVDDFNQLYNKIENNYNLKFLFDCVEPTRRMLLSQIQERKSYLCCAVNEQTNCILHKCVLVVFGTRLDKQFREQNNGDNKNINGTFMLDGRFLSFPNIMMNNNVLVHNFYDKFYAKHCKRIFLYGNVDEEKHINRAIQLVYDEQNDVLFARDVYASDYIVTDDLNITLENYLSNSGKWKQLNFIFQYCETQRNQLVDYIKLIMSHEICYSIDNLANKIIYKHDYLIELLLTSSILLHYEQTNRNDRVVHSSSKKRKTQVVLYNKESKKIVDSIVNGRLIYSVSKTFSKQRKSFPNQQDNCSNNNIEITLPVHKYRIGTEVTRITNDSVRQKMLKQKKDFVKFIDSFFHGEMTVAGKKFFLCRNARLPNVDYEAVSSKFKILFQRKIFKLIDDEHNNSECNMLLIAFNDRPTNLKCSAPDLPQIIYEFKRNMFPIELKVNEKILFINHHEGMIGLKKTIIIDNRAKINVLLTPFEYHYRESIYRKKNCNCIILENDDVISLTSKLEQYYFRDYMHLFYTLPVPKLIVALTNLKNAMPVFSYNSETENNFENLSDGYSVAVDKSINTNNKMFKLWTLVRDNRLLTAEDPYIPHITLPIRLYNNKINKLKGKILIFNKNLPMVKFTKSSIQQNFVTLDNAHVLYMAGTLVCDSKINWVYDGKRYKIESCENSNLNIYKIYLYFRQTMAQCIEKLDASMMLNCDSVLIKINIITSTNNLEGIKICSIHGQKGVFNKSEDLTEWMAEDGTHAQICLSPVSFISRQSNFDKLERKYVVRGGNFDAPHSKRYPIFNIPYMLFNNTPDNIFKEFLKSNYTGHEKIEGTRFDQWTKNQSFIGNRWAESLQWMRGGSNLQQNCGEFDVVSSLIMCNNAIMKNE
jgi:hypothetical protein